jgi:hypothetical protein
MEMVGHITLLLMHQVEHKVTLQYMQTAILLETE